MSVKWIKLTTNMFDDEKIKLIETMPDKDTILIIWVKLLVQAGKTNASGYLYLSEHIPYTDEMLSAIFNRPLGVVRLALETFQRFGMIEIDEQNFISVSNWERHQNVDGMERIKEQNRIRKQNQRERERNLLPESRDSHVTVTQSHATDIERELEKEKEKEIKDSRKQKPVYDESSQYYRMAEYFLGKIFAWKPDFKKPSSLQGWADDFRKMTEIDNRSSESIKAVIDWTTTDDFWQSNILSADKLRKQFDKLDGQMKTRGVKRRAGQQQEKPGSGFVHDRLIRESQEVEW